MRIRNTRWLLVAMLGLGLVAAGCNGGSDEPPAPLASPSELDSFRYALTATVEGGAGALGGGAPGVDISLNVTIEASGAVVAPDRQQSTIKADLGFLSINLESISIGDQSWTREPGGGWADASGGGGLGDLGLDVTPADIFGVEDEEGLQELRDLLADREFESEKINEIDTVRYTLTRADLEDRVGATGTAQDLADLEDLDEFEAAIWLERSTGYPVRFVLDAAGTVEGDETTIHLELNLTDLNDDSIEIEAPI